MVILVGKFMCGVALEPHRRVLFIPWVKRNSLMNCLKVRDYGSSFPVRYIPKNSPKTQKLQTSSLPMNNLEDKDKHNGLDHNLEKVDPSDGGKVLGRSYVPKKSVKIEKLQTSSQPRNDFEDKDKHNDSLDCGKVVGRSYIPDISVKTEKSQTSSPPMHDFEDNDKHNGSDHNVARVESSNGGKVLGRSYIPKKSVRTENLQTSSPPMNDFEDKVKHNSSDSNKLRAKNLDGRKNVVRSYALGEKLNQNKSPSNNLIFNNGPEVEEEIDHKWGSNDYEYMEDVEEVVQDLHGKDACQNLAFQADKTKQEAEKMAIAFLATRAFTTVELRKKLLAKKWSLHVVNEVIAEFRSGLLNDCLYAETFSRSRFSSLSWGPRRIQQALLRKGVSEVDAEKALKLVFKDGESWEDQESRLGLSKLSLDHLFVQASKQWLRGQVLPADKRKLRTIQWLRYRGFNWGVINFVLKKLESEYPP